MTTLTTSPDVPATASVVRRDRGPIRKIPMSRIVAVELRKSLDTRSGFWLMASIGILAVIATGAVIIFAPSDEIDYGAFGSAVGVPMTVILPIIAILSVSSEWSQRSALTTFTLVPSRIRVIAAKALLTVTIGVVSMLVALVGTVALESGVALTELRAAEGAGLEEMFLELTSTTQREGARA